MSNALAVLTSSKAELTEAEALILAEMQEDEAAYDLQPARIKIAPGGIGQFLMGDDTAKAFTAIVAISQKIRGYWPESGTGAPPLCSSPNGSHGFFSDPSDVQFEAAAKVSTPHPGIVLLTEQKALPDHFSCAACPMNQWGSAHQRGNGGGKGKACKEMRRLLVLVDGWALPALMSLPPTSIRAWDGYCSSLASKRSAYFAVRTQFELDSAKAAGGETYNIVQVSMAGEIEGVDQLRAVTELRRQYKELVGGLPIDAEEYETRANGDSLDDMDMENMEEIPF